VESEQEAAASEAGEGQERLAQLPNLPGRSSEADIRGRIRNLSESALRGRALERPASVNPLAVLLELQGSAQSEEREPPAA
jgi:hypothetical protein